MEARNSVTLLKSSNIDHINCIAVLYSSKVSAGLPLPAEDYVDKSLNLNEHLIKRPAATFIVKAHGHSMLEEGIHDEDILIVDRSVKPRPGDIVIAIIDNQMMVKKIHVNNAKQLFLHSATTTLEITGLMERYIWGVIIHVIHSFKR
jgi:DNA polymerase V